MIRSYKYRLYPNRGQVKLLEKMFAVLCELYNAAIQERRDAYRQCGISISFYDQTNQLKEIRKEREDLGCFSFHAAMRVLRRVDKNFKAFFRRIKNGEKPGYPRFKSLYHFKSVPFTYGNGLSIREKRLYILGVGEVKVKWHCPIPEKKAIKQAIIKRSCGKWYAIFQVELPNPNPVKHNGPAVGVDLGVSSIIATSDGKTVSAPRYMHKSEKKLRKQQRRMDRRKKGSKRRRKAKLQVAKTHEHIANQRRDFCHKESRKLVNQYSFIVFEDLSITEMAKNHYLSKGILDAGWGQIISFTLYKAEEAGAKVVMVDPRNTSQACSGCGNIVKKSLSVRVHRCDNCGLEIDRDINAARNILNRALGSAWMGPSDANVVVNTCVV